MKRGISPLIATVLIIGFTIGLAVIIFLWSGTFTKELTESTGEEAITKLQVLADVGIKIEKIFYKDLDLYLKLKNKKSTPIEQLKIRITDISGGAETIDLINPIPDTPLIEGFGIKDVNTGYSGFDIAKIEVTPIVIINGELVSASNIVEEFSASAEFVIDSLAKSNVASSVNLDSSTPVDLVGNSITQVDATYVPGASYDGSGAYKFDGNGYITMGDGNTLSFESDEAFSISMWIFPSGIYSGTKMIFRKISLVGSKNGYQLTGESGLNHLRFLIKDDNGNKIQVGDNVNNLIMDKWTHVVATYDGGGIDDGMKLYYDSISVPLTKYSFPAGTSLTGSIVNDDIPSFGGDPGFIGGGFGGLMDDVQIFNKALTQAEIDSLYNT